MPYNGSGVFNRNYNWVNDKNAAIPITASRVDADSNDFASGLSNAVTRDGQGAATSYIRIIGAGATPISTPPPDNASNYLILNKAGSGHDNFVYGYSNGVLRWAIEVGDNTPESGAGSGSNFDIDRYNDSGVLVDTPLSINRSTGVVTINNLNVLTALTSPPVTPSSLALVGYLTVGTTSTFTGIATFNSTVYRNAPAGQYAEYWATVAGVRSWSFGEAPSGYFRIADQSAGLERVTINSSGTMTVLGALSASTSTYPLQMTAAAGGNASTLATVTGVRQWYWGVRSDGIYQVVDNSAGRLCFYIDTGGQCVATGNMTVSGTFYTNDVHAATVYATGSLQCAVNSPIDCWVYTTVNGVREWAAGTLHDNSGYAIYDVSAGWAQRFRIDTGGTVFCNNALWVGGGSTLNGTVSCNAINCTTLNCQGNALYAGPISVGGITCSSINTQGQQITSGTISCGYLTTNGNQIDAGVINASSHLSCGANGVLYAFKNGSNQFAFSWASPQVTVWVNNTNVGVIQWYVSDERVKTNIAAPEGDALADIMQLKLISFDMPDRVEPEKPAWHVRMGLSAQDVQKIMPDAVPGEDEEELLGIQILPVLARCIGAIQQMAARIEALEARG